MGARAEFSLGESTNNPPRYLGGHILVAKRGLTPEKIAEWRTKCVNCPLNGICSKFDNGRGDDTYIGGYIGFEKPIDLEEVKVVIKQANCQPKIDNNSI